jgi:RimJ/RimL family protein N-acetyltransferase
LDTVIRPAIETDAEALQRFLAALIGEELPVLFRRSHAPAVEDQRAFIRKTAEEPRTVLLVAICDGEVVGMLDFHGHPKAQRAHAGGLGMSVAKEWRGTGIGSQLLKRLFAWAKGEGVWRVELEVLSNNVRAISFYERLGFVHEGRQTRAVEVDGEYVDIMFMAKILA